MGPEEYQIRDQAIIRLAEVLRRTGFSRTTLYNRIAKSEFPRQMSLGGRSVGWLKAEVERWIADRAQVRPEGWVPTSQEDPQDTFAAPNAAERRRGIRTDPKLTSCVVALTQRGPKLADLRLVGTKLYFDSATGSFWLKLVAESSGS